MRVKTISTVLTALLTAIVILWLLSHKKESFSNYNTPNDFMNIYYKEIAENPQLIKKYPYFGTGNKSGLRCSWPANKGCSTTWLNGRLVELTPELKKKLECRFGIKYT